MRSGVQCCKTPKPVKKPSYRAAMRQRSGEKQIWLCTKIVDDVDCLEGNAVMSLNITFLLAGHKAKSKAQNDMSRFVRIGLSHAWYACGVSR
jgi:hypothetical protein